MNIIKIINGMGAGIVMKRIKQLFTERWEFILEMPIISWIVIIGYLAVDIIYRLVVIWKAMIVNE